MLTEVIEQLRERGLMGPIQEHIGSMMALAQRAFWAGGAALLDQTPVEVDLYAQDRWINEGVFKVRQLILEHLSNSDAGDVTGELVFITVVNDIERLGDFGKSLLKLARQLGQRLPDSRYLTQLHALHEAIDRLFPKAKYTPTASA